MLIIKQKLSFLTWTAKNNTLVGDQNENKFSKKT